MTELFSLDHGGPDLAFEPFPREALKAGVTERFFSMAKRHPERVALQDATQQWRYNELARRVLQLSHYLQAHLVNVSRNGNDSAPIALLFGHHVHFPLAMLSVLALGRPYLPLDADFPPHRNARLLALARPTALLCDQAHFIEAKALAGEQLPVIVIDDVSFNKSAVDSATRDSFSPPHTRPESLAYLLYTSGTTGEPKGVYQNQRNLLHDVMQYSNAVHIRPDDRLTLLYSPSVNGAIRDIYGALLNGASLHLLSPRALGWNALIDQLHERGITIYHSIPPVFRSVVEGLKAGEVLADVRLVYLAGDRLEWRDIEAFRRCFPTTAHFYTGIGSTENATLYCHWFVPRDWPIQGVRVPLGRRIPDRHIHLFDEADNEVSPGEEGEIVTSSRYSALGYWRGHGGPEHFPADPHDPEARWVRTGDRARWREDGLLELMGRRDAQIKLNGRRIELGEIETVLGEAIGLDALAVLVRNDANGQPRSLAVWWAGNDSCETAMRALAEQRLHETMRPTTYCRLPVLPRLPNFKLDRATLAQLDAHALAQETTRAATAELSGIAKEVNEVYVRVLQRGNINPSTSLLSLGIDSLQWLTLELAIEQHFGRCPPRDLLISDGSIAGVAQWLEETG